MRSSKNGVVSELKQNPWSSETISRISGKIRIISQFSASELLSYKICLEQDKLMKLGMVTKEGLIITPILISYPEGSGKTS